MNGDIYSQKRNNIVLKETVQNNSERYKERIHMLIE